jgi:SAM-dependent methyltransferase
MSDLVAAQYERWSYPEPLQDVRDEPFQTPESHYKDLKDLYWAYWPRAPYREDLDILVAGCGTMAAACYAYLYPQARVVGIDISGNSLAHEAFLKQKHSLDNLTLRQCRIEEAGTLDRDFDFIVSHGVLHHLPDPAAGLRVLGQLLRPEGVIALMVYARYGRVGVYMLQDLFRLLGLEQTEQGVATVKDTLSVLGPHHPVRRYLQLALDLDTAPGLVDTFLHRLDHSFTVGDCLEMVSQAGLAFQGWDENGFYNPDYLIPPGHPFLAAMKKLSGPALWQASELFHGSIPLHWFYVCRLDRPETNYRIHFEGEDFLDYVPVPRVTQVSRPDPLRGQPPAIARPPFPPIPLDNWQASLFGQIDKERSIRECMRNVGLLGAAGAVDFARNFFGALWRVSYMVYRLPKQGE